jgi:hypothetical protein
VRGDEQERGEHALWVQGLLGDARSWFERAFIEAEATDEVEAMARAALGLSGLWVHERRSVVDAAVVQARQLRALSSLDPASALAVRLGTRLAAEADYRRGTQADVLAQVERAREVGDPVGVAEALSVAHHCLLAPEHAARRLALAEELLRVSSVTGRPVDALLGLVWRTVDLFLAADPRAERSLSELRAMLTEHDHGAVRFVASAVEVMLDLRAGRFEAAEAAAAAGAELGRAVGDADAVGWHGVQVLAVRWYQGRAHELAPMLATLVAAPALGVVEIGFFAALAVVAAAGGDRRAAAGALARLRGRRLADLPRSSGWLVAMYGAAEAADLLQDREVAGEVYELLAPFAERPMMASLAVTCFGSTHHALGVASLTVGEHARAVEHFQTAVRANQALGHWPAAALSRHRLSQALLARGGPDDPAAAAVALATAAAEAAALRMVLPKHEPPVFDDRLVRPETGPDVPVNCRRHGRRWQLQLGGRVTLVDDSVGLKYLAILLANPGQEISAPELAQGADRLAAITATAAASHQPVLDAAAMRDYRRRIRALQADLDAAEMDGDPQGAARIRSELDWLTSGLGAGTGPAGRPRPFGDNAERARIAVGKAIRRALVRVTTADPVIGRHLSARLQTGHHCIYHLDQAPR